MDISLKRHKARKGLGLILNLLLSLFVASLFVYVASDGVSSVPPLGTALNPEGGVWTAAQSNVQSSETLHFASLQKLVTIYFEQNGTAHIQASTTKDLFWAMGYLHAHFRLTQMDLERRQGEGQLAEILGPDLLQSDTFEDSLGLLHTAQADWQQLAPDGPGRQTINAYTQGVNDSIQQEEQNNTLPLMFTLLNYKPRLWTPIDTLVVQEDMIQSLDYSFTPLDYALLAQSLGYDRTMQWFPVLPTDTQHPYDTGPYSKMDATAPSPTQLGMVQNNIAAISDLAGSLAKLPAGAVHLVSSSNNWAVNGPKTASGNALMSGDPHQQLTLPSDWYQISGNAPGYSFSGLTIPGLPVVLIGQNQNISWSLTDVQNEATFYYLEKTDAAHPNQYYWHGAWKTMGNEHYTIAVKGAADFNLDVKQTVHGPVISNPRLPHSTISVAWMGDQVTTEVEGLLSLLQAKNYTQFRDALRTWVAPALSFVYADAQDNIGMISAGYYPLVKAGNPWMPLSGTGESDIVGTIPFDAIPQVYDPPSHMVFTANQRPVASNYPYYIGTTMDGFDNGYRANEIYEQLSQGQHFTMQDMEQIQNSTKDYLAGLLVPKLLATLHSQTTLTPTEQQASDILSHWDMTMQQDATAPSIWWTFLQQYLTDTFQPWWQAKHVPSQTFQSLQINMYQPSLLEDLETWTLKDPTNAAFTTPAGKVRNAQDVMLQAYKETISQLGKSLGKQPQQWTWGRLHSRRLDSLLQIDALNYGPLPASGDDWTINAAYGLVSDYGPSSRIIVDWGTKKSEIVYPGGQDENPISPWYQNQVTQWWNGQYNPVLDVQSVQEDPKHITWNITR